MKALNLFCIIVALTVTETTSRAADDCDLLAVKIAASYRGASVERRTEANIILFRHPQIGGFQLLCPGFPGQNPAVTLSADTAYPSAYFWEAIGNLGALVTQKSKNSILAGAQQCDRTALTSKDELAEIESDGLKVECQAFTRDGGGTLVTLYKIQGAR